MASVQIYARRGVCPLEQWAAVGVTEVRYRRAKPERLCYPCTISAVVLSAIRSWQI